MSRRRINAFLLLGLFVLYSFFIGYEFKALKVLQDDAFQTVTEDTANNIYKAVENYLSGEYEDSYKTSSLQDMVDIFCVYENLLNYPFSIKIYDKDANVVARSGSVIIYGNKCYNIEDKLTEKIKKQIYDVEFGLGNALITEIKFSGDELVEFTYGMSEFTGLTSVKISDKKPDKVIDNASFDVSYFIYNPATEHSLNKKYYDELDKEQYDKNYIDENLNFDISSDNDAFCSSCFNGPDNTTSDIVFTCNGEKYYMAFSTKHNSNYDVFHSYQFKADVIFVSLAFGVTTLIMLNAINLILKKNQRMNEAKQAFTSAAAHELKTPIAVIQNQCECIMENVAPEKNDEYIASIYDESIRMNKLVMDLLQYNRLAMSSNIQKQRVCLSDIVKAEIEKYRPLADDKSVDIKVNVKDGIMVSANADLIALVIDNYLSNAIKHTKPNHPITVLFRSKRLSVINFGSRIELENQSDLWDVFYRADKARTSDDDNSTGMGLAISKQILQLHKFKYGFDNLSNGVEFYFEIK